VQANSVSGHELVLLVFNTTQKVCFDQNVLQSIIDMRAHLRDDSKLLNALLARLRNHYIITEYEDSRVYRVVDNHFNHSPARTFSIACKITDILEDS
jgi:hypothetical protein